MSAAAECMRDMIIEKKLSFDAIVGVPRAGDPFAETLAKLLGVPCIKLIKWENDGKRCIASFKGVVPVNVRKVLLVDDLITKSESKLEAIQVLRDGGMEVTNVVVLVDRQQGGSAELDEWGCALHSVFTITELLSTYVKVGKIPPGLRADIQMYLATA